MEPRSPGSPGSASSVRPIVSGLGFSGSSTASPEEVSSGRVEGTAPVGGVRGPIQDRLVWEQPKLSRKARWRRRKQLQKRRFVDSPLPRLISPGTEDACFKCLQPGHYKRGCTNEQVCISCAEEGHGSGGCKRPRSPVSEEELRRKAMAAVALRRAAGNQPGGRGLGAPAARQPGAASQRSPAGDLRAFPSQRSPPPGPGAPRGEVWPALRQTVAVASVRPKLPPCIVRRSADMNALEDKLRFAMVAYVGGARPRVSCEQVAEALMQKVLLPRGAFSVHHYKPEDFIILFAAQEFRDRVAALPKLPHGCFTLFFRQWTRQAQAQGFSMRSNVRLALEGIPPHAWDLDTVQGVLDSSCSVVAMAPETASREDLGTFKVESWTADPEDIPTERELWVPEPSLLAGDVPSSSSCPSPVRRDSEKRLLLYRILIHVSRIDEFCELEGQRPSARVGLQRRDETGLPEADVAGEPGEGFWTSRDVTWVAGILDRRGSGDYGRRRLAGGEVAWRLPHVVGQCFRDQRIRSASIVAEEQLSVVPGGAGRGTGVEASVRGVVEQRQPSVGLDQGNSVQVASCGSAEINPNADLGQAAAELGRDAGTSPLEAGSGDKSTQVSEQQSSAVSLTESSSSAPLDPSVAREPLMEAPRFIQYGSEEFVQISVSVEGLEGPGAMPVRQDGPVEVGGPEESVGPSFPQQEDSYDGPNELMQIIENVPDEEQCQALAAQERLALEKIKGFCANLLKKLAPPLLRELDSSKKLRVEAEPFTPRRVTRRTATTATPSKPPRKVSAADTVLLKALGIASCDLEVDERHLQELHMVFDSPIREQHLRALAAIYGASVPLNLHNLEASSPVWISA
ncbi:hypothetical protein ACQ4PT_042574 [Festuca glaucescens]